MTVNNPEQYLLPVFIASQNQNKECQARGHLSSKPRRTGHTPHPPRTLFFGSALQLSRSVSRIFTAEAPSCHVVLEASGCSLLSTGQTSSTWHLYNPAGADHIQVPCRPLRPARLPTTVLLFLRSMSVQAGFTWHNLGSPQPPLPILLPQPPERHCRRATTTWLILFKWVRQYDQAGSSQLPVRSPPAFPNAGITGRSHCTCFKVEPWQGQRLVTHTPALTAT